MERSSRDLAVVGWANVLVATVIGFSAVIAATFDQSASPWELFRYLVTLVFAVVQYTAGAKLADRRGWARRCLMYVAAVQLILIAHTFAAERMTPFRNVFPPTTIMQALVFLMRYGVPVGTLLFLSLPAVRARFPQTPPEEWRRVDAPVAALALLAVVSWLYPQPPWQTPPAATESSAVLWEQPIEPGVGPATLILTFDGRPIRDFTASNLRFTLTAVKETPYIDPKTNRQTSTGVERIGPIERPWRLRHGRIRIKSIPAGVYYARVEIDRDGQKGAGVGDLAVADAHVALRTGYGPVRERVRLLQVMGLREPTTGAYPRASPSSDLPRAIPGGSLTVPTKQEVESLPQVPPHVTFAWDPVPGAVRYDLMVTCDNASEPSQQLRTNLTQTSWTADLTPCPTPYPWLVYLSATGREGYPIGKIRPAAFLIDGAPPSRSTRGIKPAALTLRPTFHGRALRDIDADDVSIELRTPSSAFERRFPPIRVRHGRIKIPRFVPDQYMFTMKIGPDARKRPDCRPVAGDYTPIDSFAPLRDVLTDWKPESRTLPVQRTLQLVEPEDPSSCAYGFTHVHSPLKLRWEPIPEAVDYTVQVRLPKAIRAEKIVVKEPSWDGPLAPSSAPNDNYFVEISGRTAKGENIAHIQRYYFVE